MSRPLRCKRFDLFFPLRPQGGYDLISIKSLYYVPADFSIPIIEKSIGFGVGASGFPRIPENEQVTPDRVFIGRIERLDNPFRCTGRFGNQEVNAVVISTSAGKLDAGAKTHLVTVEKFSNVFPKKRGDAGLGHDEHVVDREHSLNKGMKPLANVPWRCFND